MKTLVLFDIDGTMVTTGGAGRTAMRLAGQRLFGVPDLFAGRSFAGAVDNGIVGGALDAAGIPPTPRRLGRFRRTYVRILRRTIDRYPGRVHPGVRELVAALRGRALLGLQTGNWRPGAQAKLAHFGLWAPFAAGVGGFGCDADEREGLLPAALSRAMRHGWRGGRVLVLGDTPADVQCARRGVAAWRGPGVDLVTVAVRTGFAAPDALAACGPDLLFDDLAAAASAILDRT